MSPQDTTPNNMIDKMQAHSAAADEEDHFPLAPEVYDKFLMRFDKRPQPGEAGPSRPQQSCGTSNLFVRLPSRLPHNFAVVFVRQGRKPSRNM